MPAPGAITNPMAVTSAAPMTSVRLFIDTLRDRCCALLSRRLRSAAVAEPVDACVAPLSREGDASARRSGLIGRAGGRRLLRSAAPDARAGMENQARPRAAPPSPIPRRDPR